MKTNSKKITKDGNDFLNPPKNYKKSTKNQPDPKKVKKYFSDKK